VENRLASTIGNEHGGCLNSDIELRWRAALDQFSLGRAALSAGVSFSPLPGGQLNQSVRVQSAIGDWVLRLTGADDQRFAINRESECEVLQLAAQHGFAPSIVYAAPMQGLLVTVYLASPALTWASARTPWVLRALGARLRALHSVPIPATLRVVNVPDTIAHYLDLGVGVKGPVPRGDLVHRLREPLRRYQRSGDVLCHHDLHHGNVLMSEPISFVDWEYGGCGDPLFELAAVLSYHELSDAHIRLFIDAYDSTVDMKKLDDVSLLFDGLHVLWLDTANAWSMLSTLRQARLVKRLRAGA